MSKIKVLTYRVGKEPCVEEIDNGLEQLQSLVGGYIQIVPMEDYILVCNEEGAIIDLPFQEEYRMFGNFFIAKHESVEEITSLSDNDIEYVKKNIQSLLSNINRFM